MAAGAAQGTAPSGATAVPQAVWPTGGNATEVLTPENHRVAGPNASRWAIPDAKHIKGIDAQLLDERRVVSFFDEALLGR